MFGHQPVALWGGGRIFTRWEDLIEREQDNILPKGILKAQFLPLSFTNIQEANRLYLLPAVIFCQVTDPKATGQLIMERFFPKWPIRKGN